MATITATNEIFGILPSISIVFFPLDAPFFDGSVTLTCFSSFLKISDTIAVNPTDDSTITDVAVNNSNLENVDPAYAPTMPIIKAKTIISFLRDNG